MNKKNTQKNTDRFFSRYKWPGYLERGPLNKITDVAGVLIGHSTKYNPQKGICTGVTIIDPGSKDMYRNKIPAAVAVGNGYGKMTGVTQIMETGLLETPIALTNTHAVGTVMQSLANMMAESTSNLDARDTFNVVVGETNDGYLNSLHAPGITSTDVQKAWEGREKDFFVGCVGAGTGTRAFSWKGGIGSASRKIIVDGKTYMLGTLLQTNFGGSLNIHGVEVGMKLGMNDYNLTPQAYGDGSCMIVIATDAPLTARQLERIARRAFLGLAKTGAILAPMSGDYAIAFTTSPDGVETGVVREAASINDRALAHFFLATVECVTESVYDALYAAKETTGRDRNILKRLPFENITELKIYAE